VAVAVGVVAGIVMGVLIDAILRHSTAVAGRVRRLLTRRRSRTPHDPGVAPNDPVTSADPQSTRP